MYAAAAARGRVSRPRLIALQPARNTLAAEWTAGESQAATREEHGAIA